MSDHESDRVAIRDLIEGFDALGQAAQPEPTVSRR